MKGKKLLGLADPLHMSMDMDEDIRATSSRVGRGLWTEPSSASGPLFGPFLPLSRKVASNAGY